MYNCSLLGCSQQVAANIFMFVFKKNYLDHKKITSLEKTGKNQERGKDRQKELLVFFHETNIMVTALLVCIFF